MSEVHKVVLMGEQTVGNIKQVLKDALMWLSHDAAYAHPNSKIRQFRQNVESTLLQVKIDEQKFLGKKFTVDELVAPVE